MKKIPDKTMILHWIERRSQWAELPWSGWVRFRGYDTDKSTSLPGAEAGEHFFLVCMLGAQGELCNVIPHRYVVSTDALLVYGFDGLDVEQREESDRIDELAFPMLEDIERSKQLDERGFSVNLPPLHTVQDLLQAMPGIAGAHPEAACWDFLSAIGVCRSNQRAN